MRKLFVFFLFEILFGPIVSGQHRIEINIQDLKDTTVIVGYHFGNQRLVHDTVKINAAGQILIKGDILLDTGLYFIYSPSHYLEFIVAEQVFSITTTVSAGYGGMRIEGSKENEWFKKFQLAMLEIQKEQQIWSSKLKSATNSSDSSVSISAIRSLNIKADSIRDKLVEEGVGSFFSSFLSLMQGIKIPPMPDSLPLQESKKNQYDYYRNHYMDLVNRPVSLMRTPVLHAYVMKYFTEIILPIPDTINYELDKFIARLAPHHATFRYWLITLYNHFQESKIMGMDAVVLHLLEKYYLTERVDWIDEAAKKELSEEIDFIKPNLIGKASPKIQVLDTLLRPYWVQQLPAKYLVLYFYDPDCGVCKKKTPLLKEQYPEIKKVGGEVAAISTITDIEKWKKYVKTNNLSWINGSDPYVRSNFRREYNVRSTPQIYILDKERKIIAKKLDVDQIVDFLQQHEKLQSATK